MPILEQLKADVVVAMKAGEKEKVGALRLIVSEIQRAVKDGEVDEIAVLQTARKKRLESAKAFRDGGRGSSAAQEESEARLIERYLPAQLSDEQLVAIVADTIAEIGAAGLADTGKTIGAVMPKVKGRADGSRVSAAVRERLAP